MTRRRVTVAAGADPATMVTAFRWGSGDGCSGGLTGAWHFANEAAARAGWEQVRRHVWAQHHRFGIPRSAEHFDQLSYDAAYLVRSSWNYEEFPLAAIFKALAADRAHLEAFARTPAATDVADYLDMARSDFDVIEGTARRLAAWVDGPWWTRPYPHNLGTSARYGSAETA